MGSPCGDPILIQCCILLFVVEQDVVDDSNVDTSHLAIAVEVASGEEGLVVVEQVVVEGGDVD